MQRRQFLKRAAAAPLVPMCWSPLPASMALAAPAPAGRRVRPADPEWPSAARWEELSRLVEGRLVKIDSPIAACQKAPSSAECDSLFKLLKNPFAIRDHVGLTQTSGWVDAWTSSPSVYAVRAAKTEHVAAAVSFAREHNLRLVVKGGGHSYQGTSNAPDSLLIWTRDMDQIALHDAFVPEGCEGKQAPRPAVTVGAGVIWLHAYDAVTTKAGRYVQGGGCTTVGVAGLIQSGGFGSFSKGFGLAAAGLLEAEVVTADGAVRIANACKHPDLFWGLKGGGGGSLGVVTRLTLRTRELPAYFGGVFGAVRARSDDAFRKLAARVVGFYRDNLFNRHWGEQIRFERGNSVSFEMVFQGIDRGQAERTWRTLFDWVAGSSGDYSIEMPLQVVDVPARHFWDAEYMQKTYPQFIRLDDRPGAPAGSFFWADNLGEAGQVLHAYKSAWLPASLLEPDRQSSLVDALFACTRHRGVSLHCNKGLAGASAEDLAAARDTATNPAVLDAFALAIIATGGPPAFPGVAGHEPDVAAARRQAAEVTRAMEELLKVAPGAGSYVSESDFFERDWQRSHWGESHARLAAVKRKYDSLGLFFVHHGVGSEEWSPDGFQRIV